MNYNEILNIALRNGLPSDYTYSISEYLEHNEWGIAFEVLCSAIDNDGISITMKDFNEIKRIGEYMEMSDELWNGLIVKSFA